MYNILFYKVYIYFVKLELQLLNKQNHSTDKGENFCLFRALFGCIVTSITIVFQIPNHMFKKHVNCLSEPCWREDW